MKRELNVNELEEVTGGSVTLSAQLNMVRFKSIKTTCMLNKDVQFTEVRNCLLDLYDANADKVTDEEFDNLVMNEFHERGYI